VADTPQALRRDPIADRPIGDVEQHGRLRRCDQPFRLLDDGLQLFARSRPLKQPQRVRQPRRHDAFLNRRPTSRIPEPQQTANILPVELDLPDDGSTHGWLSNISTANEPVKSISSFSRPPPPASVSLAVA
jgi:hypothetical protein